MRVLVCGGREYRDETRVNAVLDAQNRVAVITMIIHGGALGADALGRAWAESRCVDCLRVPADWSAHGRRAGPLRNARILEYAPHLVIAFPGGIGTANMIKQARDAGVHVFEIHA